MTDELRDKLLLTMGEAVKCALELLASQTNELIAIRKKVDPAFARAIEDAEQRQTIQ